MHIGMLDALLVQSYGIGIKLMCSLILGVLSTS